MGESLGSRLFEGEKRKAARAFAVAASYLRGGILKDYGAPRDGMGEAMTGIGIMQQAEHDDGRMPCFVSRCWKVAVIVLSILHHAHQPALVRNS
jgi:hypothetical protein